MNYRAQFFYTLFTTSFFMILGISEAYANNRCANPSEVLVKDQVTIKFCEIPAADGILIGTENQAIPRNFNKFQMAQFEVTQLQFKTVTGTEPWKNEDGQLRDNVQEGDNNPAVYITYEDAQRFTFILSSLVDNTAIYRLPTEAEFEYATRGSANRQDKSIKERRYPWGDFVDANLIYFDKNTKDTGQYARSVNSCPNFTTNQNFAGYCANDFGLYHMLGNVEEWVLDTYKFKSLFRDYVPRINGHSPVTGEADASKVIRGGSWRSRADQVTSAKRASSHPTLNRYDSLGFRVVRMSK